MSSAPLGELHRHVVQAATLAPSVHNTQPWRFSAFPGDGTSARDGAPSGDGAYAGLDLWADPGRRLPVLDPQGRQLHLSCGAALLHTRVAARGIGLDATVELLPDPAEPTHLARLHLTPGAPASQDELSLAEAILRRHTYRDAFESRRLPAELLERLQLAAEAEGARLRAVTRPDDLVQLEVLLSRADAAEQADPAYRAEVEAWVRTDDADDGVPRAALPADPQRGSSLRLRDFGGTTSRTASDDPPVPERPDVAVLLTDDDSAGGNLLPAPVADRQSWVALSSVQRAVPSADTSRDPLPGTSRSRSPRLGRPAAAYASGPSSVSARSSAEVSRSSRSRSRVSVASARS